MTLRLKMTARRYDYLRQVISGKSMTDIAKADGVSPSAVSFALRQVALNNGFYYFKEMLTTISRADASDVEINIIIRGGKVVDKFSLRLGSPDTPAPAVTTPAGNTVTAETTEPTKPTRYAEYNCEPVDTTHTPEVGDIYTEIKTGADWKVVHKNRHGVVLESTKSGYIMFANWDCLRKFYCYVKSRNTLKIAVGKFYKTRDGRKAIVCYKANCEKYPFVFVIDGCKATYSCTDTGEYISGKSYEIDLVEEWGD